MYNFTRTVTIRNGASTTKAVGFAMELTGYINKTYNVNIRCGMEMFGGANIHWQYDQDNLDKISALNAKLFEDKAYWGMIEKAKDFFVDGSMRDSIVNYPT